MIIENFKIAAEKKNIYTAAGMHRCMVRELGDDAPKYEVVLRFWDGKGKVSTLELACAAIGISGVKF